MAYNERALGPSVLRRSVIFIYSSFHFFFVLLHKDSSTLTKLLLTYFFFLSLLKHSARGKIEYSLFLL